MKAGTESALRLIATILFASGLASSLPATAQIYVATNGHDGWTGRLAAPNADGTDGPVATLDQACEIAASGKEKSIHIRAGTYYLTRPLHLTSEHSGLRISNYSNEHVIISGGTPISNFKEEGAEIFSAQVPSHAALPVRLLRAGAHYLPIARYPVPTNNPDDVGQWLFAKEEPLNYTRSSNWITCAPGALKEWANPEDMEVNIFPSQGWLNQWQRIIEIDHKSSEIHLNSESYTLPILQGNRFYISNVKEQMLQQPLTWCYDSKSNKVWCHTPAQGTNNKKTAKTVDSSHSGDASGTDHSPGDDAYKDWVVPALNVLVLISTDGYSLKPTHDIVISGLEFRDSAYSLEQSPYAPYEAAVVISGAESCEISENRFATLGGYAIRLENGSRKNTITHNTISELGGGGILLAGGKGSQPVENSISNNLIENCGLIFKHVAGILCDSAAQTNIVHNKIRNMPRYGISLKSASATSVTKQTVVDSNEIINTNRETKDSGAIEVLGRGKVDTNDLITNNLIVNSGGLFIDPSGKVRRPYQTWGVYLDDFSSGVTISNNALVNCAWGGVMLHGGQHNVISNNVFAGTNGQQVWIQAHESDPAFFRDNTIQQNVMLLSNKTSRLYRSSGFFALPTFKTIDSNLYWSLADRNFWLSDDLTPLGAYKAWQLRGFDKHSILANPQLGPDYKLKAGSPAAKLGIKGYRGSATLSAKETFGVRIKAHTVNK